MPSHQVPCLALAGSTVFGGDRQGRGPGSRATLHRLGGQLKTGIVQLCGFWWLMITRPGAPASRRRFGRTSIPGDRWSRGWIASGSGGKARTGSDCADVGPTLNGIEVARRILTCPGLKSCSGELDRRILSRPRGNRCAGAFKSDAGPSYCLPSRQSKESRSSGLVRQALERTTGAPRGVRRHEAEFCSDEASLLDGFARFAEGALAAGNATIVVATSLRRNALHRRLQARGLDIDLAIAERRYVSLDVADTLSTFMVNGWPDEARFWKATTPLIVDAARASTGEPPRVAACGECAPSLWRQGHAAAAVRLEQLWNELARTYDVDIWCGYSLEAPLHDDEHRIFQQICAEHSAVHSG